MPYRNLDQKIINRFKFCRNMVFGTKDRSIEEILQTLDKLAVSPDDLEHWTMAVETTAKSMSHDKGDKIQFEYYPEEKVMKFYVKDAKSRDDLVNSVEMHLPLIPESLQGFFSVFKYNLKNVKFENKS
jgi:3-hydroxyisobutyrate dehydrogenase-like beta-hydroxyacid dehydrogenase